MHIENERGFGISCALLAYFWWGLAPIYWKLLGHVSAEDILIHRLLWSVPTVAIILIYQRRLLGVLKELRAPRLLALFAASSALLMTNWGIYVWAVLDNQIKEASLGYFILPLLSVLVGYVLFRERPSRVQWLSIGIAAIGIVVMIASVGKLPWVALGVALTFCFYGALRKATTIDSVGGNFLETAVALPFFLGWMLWNASSASFGQVDTSTDLLLIGSGLVTVVPLIAYVAATHRATLTSLSLIFYLGPTIQLLVAVAVYGEPVTTVEWYAFAFVWLGLLIHSADQYRRLDRADAATTVNQATDKQSGSEIVDQR